jgi:Flp pilus assembly protein TadG
MKNRQRGVAAVELALVLPLLLAIGFAITEFGRGIYTYNTLAKSARDAARYLSTQAQGDQIVGTTTTWITARNLVVYGNPAGTGSPLVPGLDSSNMVTMVKICDASITACQATHLNQGTFPAINTVSVTISGYTFTPVLDILGFTRFYTGGTSSITSIPFSDISVTMRQRG